MLINNIEIAELKELKITVGYDTIDLKCIESMTPYKCVTGINTKINFTLNKVTSRFKPSLLACVKKGEPMQFDLYAEVESPNGDIESINIIGCWIEGEFDLIHLQSETDFTTEEYSGGFYIENADFIQLIHDENSWSYK